MRVDHFSVFASISSVFDPKIASGRTDCGAIALLGVEAGIWQPVIVKFCEG
jgi:hypothetical protein